MSTKSVIWEVCTRFEFVISTCELCISNLMGQPGYAQNASNILLTARLATEHNCIASSGMLWLIMLALEPYYIVMSACCLGSRVYLCLIREK